MSKYRFHQDSHVKGWERVWFEIEAKSYTDALQIVKEEIKDIKVDCCDNKAIEIVSREDVFDTYELVMTTDGANLEIFDEDGTLVANNIVDNIGWCIGYRFKTVHEFLNAVDPYKPSYLQVKLITKNLVEDKEQIKINDIYPDFSFDIQITENSDVRNFTVYYLRTNNNDIYITNIEEY